MFAVVKTGGKQYRVAVDDVIRVEKLAGEAGSSITFEDVLMVGDDNGLKVGTPVVSGISVTADIIEQTRGDKIIIFKKKRRHNYRRKNGHRQELTVLRITGIGDAKSAAPKKAASKKTEDKPEDSKAEAPSVEKDQPTTDKTAEKKAPAKKAAEPKKAATKAADAKPAAKKPAAKKPAAKKAATKKAEEK
ncbi:MAG: 50S ribosomal protein L21 [Sphingomonadales bacterium]